VGQALSPANSGPAQWSWQAKAPAPRCYTRDLEGKILIVTSSSGIGGATARMATQAGAHVVVATGDEITGIDLASETGAELWTGELARHGAAESVLALCVSKFGRVDALFNAAGLSGRRFGDGPVDECTDEGWETTLTQNLEITFRMCRAVVGRMLQQAVGESGIRGAILNMGSALAEAPEPRHFAHHAYAAAKGGVVAMSRAMAAYYAPQRIRVNVLAPALVRTPASERASGDPEVREFIRKKQPLADGMVDTGDVARTALFLLGDGARSITGEVLTVDAGWKLTGV
jgi:NAD(P)-dependent dehydrogenase (short-subunit alcohol dehydrogenase family)